MAGSQINAVVHIEINRVLKYQLVGVSPIYPPTYVYDENTVQTVFLVLMVQNQVNSYDKNTVLTVFLGSRLSRMDSIRQRQRQHGRARSGRLRRPSDGIRSATDQ